MKTRSSKHEMTFGYVYSDVMLPDYFEKGSNLN